MHLNLIAPLQQASLHAAWQEHMTLFLQDSFHVPILMVNCSLSSVRLISDPVQHLILG
jgi:hypothetical protein